MKPVSELRYYSFRAQRIIFDTLTTSQANGNPSSGVFFVSGLWQMIDFLKNVISTFIFFLQKLGAFLKYLTFFAEDVNFSKIPHS